MKTNNRNSIVTDGFSNPESEALYQTKWHNEPDTATNFYDEGKQCGGCSFYAEFNADWGLCCHPDSRHHLETVFEHFTCPSYVDEGWDAHRFLTVSHREAVEAFEKQNVAICRLVSQHVSSHNLGTVTNRDSTYLLHGQLWPLKPDLGFIAKDRPVKVHDSAYLVAPDLAIKIVTSFDSAELLNDDIIVFLEAGTRQV